MKIPLVSPHHCYRMFDTNKGIPPRFRTNNNVLRILILQFIADMQTYHGFSPVTFIFITDKIGIFRIQQRHRSHTHRSNILTLCQNHIRLFPGIFHPFGRIRHDIQINHSILTYHLTRTKCQHFNRIVYIYLCNIQRFRTAGIFHPYRIATLIPDNYRIQTVHIPLRSGKHIIMIPFYGIRTTHGQGIETSRTNRVRTERRSGNNRIFIHNNPARIRHIPAFIPALVNIHTRISLGYISQFIPRIQPYQLRLPVHNLIPLMRSPVQDISRQHQILPDLPADSHIAHRFHHLQRIPHPQHNAGRRHRAASIRHRTIVRTVIVCRNIVYVIEILRRILHYHAILLPRIIQPASGSRHTEIYILSLTPQNIVIRVECFYLRVGLLHNTNLSPHPFLTISQRIRPLNFIDISLIFHTRLVTARLPVQSYPYQFTARSVLLHVQSITVTIQFIKHPYLTVDQP